MAVIQISKIQVRRGLQENLPQLASGEMGWSVDERRLWIGNGTLAEGAPEEGNTEILTSRTDILQVIQSYTFHGEESGYVSQTGPSSLSNVIRTLQNKFDEQISLRDFIRPEEAATNDYAIPLQRAIDELFPADYYTTVGVRRRLHIPAGVYPVSTTITIPPYASIFGDGPRSTIIKLNTSAGTQPLIRLRDSRGEVGENIDLVTSDAPFQVTFKDLTLQTDLDNDIALLESCQFVDFDRVRFQGAVQFPTNLGSSKSAVVIKELLTPVQKVSFTNCEFVRATTGIYIDGDVKSVTADNCLFDTLFQGVYAVSNIASPQGIKVTSSQFDNISAEAIVSLDESSITSAFNYYRSVGTTDGFVITTATPTYSILKWANSNNYSISDLFERSLADQQVKSLIEFVGDTAPSYTAATSSGTLVAYPGYSETIIDDNTNNLGLMLADGSTAIIDYKITRSGQVRSGTIKVSQVAGVALYDDEYTETANVGVILDFTSAGNDAYLSYTSTSTGSAATINYNLRTFV